MRIYSHIICDFITRRSYYVTNYAKSMLKNVIYKHHRPFIYAHPPFIGTELSSIVGLDIFTSLLAGSSGPDELM